MTQRPVGKADRDQVAALHTQGLSRNAIARQIGRSGRTVSRLAAELGLSFERSGGIVAATEARKTDAADRRSRIQVDSLAAAERLLGQMFAPAKVYNFGGKENDYNERQHEEPPFRDKQAIANAIQALSQTALKLAEYDKATEGGGAAVDEWLDAMLGTP